MNTDTNTDTNTTPDIATPPNVAMPTIGTRTRTCAAALSAKTKRFPFLCLDPITLNALAESSLQDMADAVRFINWTFWGSTNTTRPSDGMGRQAYRVACLMLTDTANAAPYMVQRQMYAVAAAAMTNMKAIEEEEKEYEND